MTFQKVPPLFWGTAATCRARGAAGRGGRVSRAEDTWPGAGWELCCPHTGVFPRAAGKFGIGKSWSVAPSAGCEPGRAPLAALRSALAGKSGDRRHREERQDRHGPGRSRWRGLGTFSGCLAPRSGAVPSAAGARRRWQCGDSALCQGCAWLSLGPVPKRVPLSRATHPFAVPNGWLCSELCFA